MKPTDQADQLYTQQRRRVLERFPRLRLPETAPAWPGQWSRTQLWVPELPERRLAAASLYDPVKEAQRLLPARPQGALFIWGWGGGFLAEAAAAQTQWSRICVFCPYPDEFAATLGQRDLGPCLEDPRLEVLGPFELKSWSWSPLLHGPLSVIESRTEFETWQTQLPEQAQAVRAEWQQIFQIRQRDFQTQAEYGRLWHRNFWSLHRRGSLGLASPEFRCRRAWVVAAGPGTDDMPRLWENHPKDLIVATDAAVSILGAQGLRPDYGLVMDPQVYTWLHRRPETAVRRGWLVEGAAHPHWAEVPHSVWWSPHPLLRRASAHFGGPCWDTWGANVTYSALRAAEALEPEEIWVLGADYGYPLGQEYARGSYRLRYSDRYQTRLSPLSHRTSGYLGDSSARRTEEAPPAEGWYWTSDGFAGLAELWNQAPPVRIPTKVFSRGLPWSVPLGPRVRPETTPWGAPGWSPDAWARFAETWLTQLKQRDSSLLADLSPLGAWLRKQNPSLSPSDLINALWEQAAQFSQDLSR